MQRNIVLRLTSVLVLFASLNGCINYTHKNAEEKPDSEVAVIKTLNKAFVIVSIDGDDTLPWLLERNEYRVAPGKYRVRVSASLGGGVYPPVARDVELLAGHTYGLTGKTSFRWWRFEIRDLETGQRADDLGS